MTDEQIGLLVEAERESGKKVDIQTYEGAPPAFCNETRQDSYDSNAARASWESTIAFLNACFHDDLR